MFYIYIYFLYIYSNVILQLINYNITYMYILFIIIIRSILPVTKYIFIFLILFCI